MAEAEALKRRKGGLRSSLTVLTEDQATFLPTASAVQIEIRIGRLVEQIDKYKKVVDDLADLLSETEYASLIAVEEPYISELYVTLATFKDRLYQIQPKTKGSGPKTESKTQHKQNAVKLPKLTLPTFSGDSTLWYGFWDIYLCSVHQNVELTDVQKFTYLRGQLRGDALKLIEGFAVTGDSYEPAVDVLQDAYGHPERIKAAHVLKFCGLKSPRHNAEDLQDYYANMESCMRSIISLQVTLEEFSVIYLLNKLPSPLRETIRREMGEHNLEYNSFAKCLQAEIYNLSSASRVQQVPYPEATSAFTTQTVTRSISCVLCDGTNHLWFRCFKYRSAAQKVSRARQINRCPGCLASDHGGRGCTNPEIKKCKFCKGKHFHMLCTQPRRSNGKGNATKTGGTSSGTPTSSASNTESTNRTTMSMAVGTSKTSVILPTIQLPVKGVDNKTVQVRAVLDQCSQKTFIRRAIVPSLCIECKGSEELRLQGFTGAKESREYCVIALKYKHRGRYQRLQATVVDELPEHKADTSLQVDLNRLSKRGIKLADPRLTQTSQLDILIGADNYYNIVHPKLKKEGDLVLIPTKFGYALSGSYSSKTSSSTTEIITVLKVAVNSTDQILNTGQYPCDDQLKTLWELDHIGISPKEHSQAERQALCSFEESVSYDSDSQQYQVRLPWTERKCNLPTNKGLAIGRLRGLQRRFIAEPGFGEKYAGVVSDQLKRGFIEEVPFDDETQCHYLAHHGVIKDSTTTPVRVVFDCSAKIRPHLPSLNDCLHTGPSLVPELAKVLLRFRLHRFAWVSDIEKAFLMLTLHQADRDYTRFLWPRDPFSLESPLQCFRFKTVLFGATCSQFLLNATILKHLSLEHLDADLVKSIKDGLYVDNLLGTGDDESCLLNTYAAVRDIMEDAHLFLKEWATNSPQLLDRLRDDEVAAKQQDSVKVLGLLWDTNEDSLSFKASVPSSCGATKRECLSTSAKLFDPLGFLLPVTIKSRIFLQRLWRLKLDWDTELTGDVRVEWDAILADLVLCCGSSVPRRISYTGPVSLHAFADASNLAYGTAVYLTSPHGSHLVMARAKVAPIKSLTVPKMELTAVLLAARLIKFVEEAFQDILTISSTYMWSDSQITLYWLHSSKKLPVYVTNRVDEIRSLIPTATYRYVPTTDNPSDLVSRGVSAKCLSSSALWWQGPSWLLNQNEWPDNIELHEPAADVALQVNVAQQNGIQLWDWESFGSFEKHQRVMAWVIRFISNLKAKKNGLQPTSSATLNCNEIRAADQTLIKLCQKEVYSQELQILSKGVRSRNKTICQLKLFLKDDIIRCEGRLTYAAQTNVNFPILLPSNHPLTHLIIEWCHRLCSHFGVNYVVTYVRQRWWVPRIRQIVKKVLRQCLRCRRVQGKPYAYAGPPPLPTLRINPGDPYKVTGIDYSGAISVKDSPNIKAYMILFTCAVTRSIHLEVVTNLTCDSFLHAFRRFCSRQGFPRIILSDNATTFVGASKHLKDLYDQPEVQRHMNTVQCEWRFIPARAPWFGAIWERAIGIVKSSLKRVLGRALVSLEELTTILQEAEAVVNDRPLYYASGDLDELTPITPSILVRGYRLRDLPDDDAGDVADPDYTTRETITARYKYVRKLSLDLRKRWSNEYLLTLRDIRINKHRPLQGHWPKVGDMVTIHDEGPRMFWKLGRIEELLPGRDGETRVARVRTKNGTTLRPTVRLYPLEGDLDVEDSTSSRVTQSTDGLDSPSDGDSGPSTPNEQPADVSSGRPSRQAAQVSAQSWRDKLASGLL